MRRQKKRRQIERNGDERMLLMCVPSVLWMRTDWPPSMVRARSPAWRRRAERCWSQCVRLRAESQLRQDEQREQRLQLSLSLSLSFSRCQETPVFGAVGTSSPKSLSLSLSLCVWPLALPSLCLLFPSSHAFFSLFLFSFRLLRNAPLSYRLSAALHQLVPRQPGGVDIWQPVNYSLSASLSLLSLSLSPAMSLFLRSPEAFPPPLFSRV